MYSLGVLRVSARQKLLAVVFCALVFYALRLSVVLAQNAVYFSTMAAGQTKSIAQWGADTASPSADNMR
jgi:hypothetical protein